MKLTTEVIICTFNGEKYVIEQLQSVLQQTIEPTRISIYDDCSNDSTVEVIQHFISGIDDNVRGRICLQIRSTNLGYAKNFVTAIEQSSEDIIFLCDQDDIWEATKIEILLGLLADKAVDMVVSDGQLISSDGRLMKKTVLESYGIRKYEMEGFSSRAFEYLIKRNYINGAAVAIRSVAAKSALPLPCDMPHDYWLAIWCALHSGIAVSPIPLYRYRLHGNNVIGIGSSNLIYSWLGVWRQPRLPRERELRIWKAVCERLEGLPLPRSIDAAKRKLEWLITILDCRKNPGIRFFSILSSYIIGNYRRYSPPQAFVRDLVSIIK